MPDAPPPARTALLSPRAVSLALGIAGAVTFGAGGWSIGGTVLPTQAMTATRVTGDEFPRQLIDPLGIAQTIPKPPERIASAALLGDEILTALVPPERFVGVTYWIDDPATSNAVDLAPPNAERIAPEIETLLRLEPDLVVVADFTRPEAVRLLLSAGLPVLRFTRYRSFADTLDNIRTAGAAVGADARAAELIASLEERIHDVERRVAGRDRPRVLYYITGGFTSGRDTIVDEAITLAGGYNVAREAGLRGQATISVEVAIGLEPEVILLPTWRHYGEASPLEHIRDNPVWRDVPAVRNDRVYTVSSQWTVTVSHYAVNGLEEIARLLHPESFET